MSEQESTTESTAVFEGLLEAISGGVEIHHFEAVEIKIGLDGIENNNWDRLNIRLHTIATNLEGAAKQARAFAEVAQIMRDARELANRNEARSRRRSRPDPPI